MPWSASIKEKKRILAIDYGTKKVGLSYYKEGETPFPCLGETLKNSTENQLIKDLLVLIKEEDFNIIVLGLPTFTDGKETVMSQKVRDFGKKIQEEFQGQLYFQNEVLTSSEARERMKNSPRFNFKVDESLVDQVSASIILEDFLDDFEKIK